MPWDSKDKSTLKEFGLSWQGPRHYPFEDITDTGETVYRHILASPCNCVYCLQEFRTSQDTTQANRTFAYCEGLSEIEAQERASKFVNTISGSLRYLQEQCKLNGNTLVKRWKKIGDAGRKELLLKVHPQIYASRWCDVELCDEYMPLGLGLGDNDSGYMNEGMYRRPYRDALLLPYINLEALTEDPFLLLSLLYYRSKHPPHLWSAYDNSLLDKQWELGAFATTYNDGAISLEPANYGTWTPWSEDAVHDGFSIGFPRGILLLEAQQKLLSFLRNTVQELLEGRHRLDSSNQSDRFFAMFENESSSSIRRNPGKHQLSVFLNQAFTAPAAFNIDAFGSVATLQRNMQADHLTFLQTDPKYMRHYISQVLEDATGDGLREDLKNSAVAMWFLKDTSRLLSWERICEETEKLQQLFADSYGHVVHEKQSAAKIRQAMGCISALLSKETKWRLDFIGRSLPTRPGFRKHYNFHWLQGHGGATMVMRRVRFKETYTDAFSTDRLEFCLRILVLDPWDIPSNSRNPVASEFTRRFEPSDIFAMLDQHLSECQKKGKKDELARLDQVLYELYSELSAVFQMLSMLRLHQATFQQLNPERIKSEQSGKAWRYIQKGFHTFTDIPQGDWDAKTGRITPLHTIVSNSAKVIPQRISEKLLGQILAEFIKCPVPKGNRYTETWLEQSKVEQDALNKFWQALGDYHRWTLESIGLGTEDIESDMGAFSFATTPEHLAQIERQREEILATIAAKAALQAAKKNQKADKASLQTQWGEDKEQSFEVRAPKIKPKTRGASDGVSSDVSESAAVDDTEPQITVAVNKRALSVFKAMFPGSNIEDRSKAIDWEDFVNAMAGEEIGFVARHSGGGSAYTFEPNEHSLWYGKGAISFHKPHPEHIIDAITIMAYGKRMAKWFGWNEETFVLKK